MNTQLINKRIRLIMDLRKKGIRDASVLGAIEKVPRDFFISETLKDQAWDDIALPIDCGQTISQPFIVAKMTEGLALSDRDRVLEIGTGCGYQTAILAHLARRVYTIERHRPLSEAAELRFQALKLKNITAMVADGMKGWPQANNAEPMVFDKIIVTAAAQSNIPQALLDQLKPDGVIVIPVAEQGRQVLKKITKQSTDTFAEQDICDVRFVPLLPDVA